jgi:ketosteroid isomerase-like protein
MTAFGQASRPDHMRSLRPIPLRLLLLALPLVALAGCSSSPQRACGGNTDYLAAVERPPLQLPPEIVPTERMKPLAIPPVDPVPNVLDPVPACLDQPPRYFARKGAAADPAEEVVRAWNAAWAARQADAVIRTYSEAFQAPGQAGSAEFLDQREQQVATGPAPDAKLEDVTVTAAGPDRRVVTFVQRFGDGALRRELTLVREPAGWRIVSERTLEVL